jgi:hypothetical protein
MLSSVASAAGPSRGQTTSSATSRPTIATQAPAPQQQPRTKTHNDKNYQDLRTPDRSTYTHPSPPTSTQSRDKPAYSFTTVEPRSLW